MEALGCTGLDERHGMGTPCTDLDRFCSGEVHCVEDWTWESTTRGGEVPLDPRSGEGRTRGGGEDTWERDPGGYVDETGKPQGGQEQTAAGEDRWDYHYETMGRPLGRLRRLVPKFCTGMRVEGGC